MFNPLPLIAAFFGAVKEGVALYHAIFTARNSPAMQANAKAATIAKIRASANEHIASGNLRAVQEDGATE